MGGRKIISIVMYLEFLVDPLSMIIRVDAKADGLMVPIEVSHQGHVGVRETRGQLGLIKQSLVWVNHHCSLEKERFRSLLRKCIPRCLPH